MELSIDYTCPECSRLTTTDLLEIGPGKTLHCNDCDTPLILTEEALRTFSNDLYRLPQA